ncbi:MAG: hypothetical protein WCC06_10665 [Candidatus Aminicenantales bacterium]
MQNGDNGTIIGIKWSTWIFCLFSLASISSCVISKLGIHTGYRWWWWLIVVILTISGGGIAYSLHQARASRLRNKDQSDRRLRDQFRELLETKKIEVQAGRMTIGLGCIKGIKSKTEITGTYQAWKYELAPVTFDTSLGTEERKYRISKTCPTCGRQLEFNIKRHPSKPKVRLTPEERANHTHKEYGWPLILHKMQSHIRGIRGISIFLLILVVILLILIMHLRFNLHSLEKQSTIFILLALPLATLLFAVYLFFFPFKWAIKHIQHEEKVTEQIWRGN